jgi:hypothetical protein
MLRLPGSLCRSSNEWPASVPSADRGGANRAAACQAVKSTLADEVNDENWSYGMRADYLRKLLLYWRDQFDWRAAEDSINDFDQFLVEIDRLDLHFIHQRSPHEDAMPLILTHGWPGRSWSLLESIPD